MRTMPITAIAIASGMASATISAAAKAAEGEEQNDHDQQCALARLMATVLSMRLMNSARS